MCSIKGMVHSPVTRLVAVKRLEHKPASSLHNRFVDFDSELKLLARLHHLNLVNLVGFCHERGAEANFRVSPHGIRCAIKYAIHSYKYAQHQHHATALSSLEASLEKQEQGIIHDRRLLVFDYMENGTLDDHLRICTARVNPREHGCEEDVKIKFLVQSMPSKHFLYLKIWIIHL